jgi:HK97 family phage portal protein
VFSKLFERRASPENPKTSLADPDKWLYQALGGMPSSSGMAVSEQSAMGLTSVYACINILASALGQLPCNLYRERQNEKQIEKAHPVYDILRKNPNPDMTAFTFFQTMQASAAGWGNSYALILSRRNGSVGELWPLASATTTPKRVNGELVYEFERNGKRSSAPASEILHIKGLSGDGLVGWSPIKTQRELIGAGLAQQRFSGGFYANGATPSGVLSFPGKVQDSNKLREEWQASQTGENRGKVAVLEQGMKYEQISIDPVDADYVETSKMTAVQVASIFRVPPHMINVLDRATWGNVESLGLEFVVHTLGAWFIAWQQELERKLLTPREQAQLSIRFDPRALMRGDHKSRALYYKSAVNDGWMTRNEVRALEDLNPLEGLDKPLQPMNMIGANDPRPDLEPKDPDDDDENGDEQKDEAARAAFTAQVEKLYLREKEKLTLLLKRSHHVSPEYFMQQVNQIYVSDARHIATMFGCKTDVSLRFKDRRVFALSGLFTIKSVQDWLDDEVSRRAEIEECFR